MIFNLIVYVLVLRVIILHTCKKNKRMNKSPLTLSEALKMLLSFSGIMFLFGFTWLFAVFTFISEPNVSFVIQFIFAFFNAFQGFFIFIFFVVLSSDSREAWKSLLCPWTQKEQTTSKYLSSSNKLSSDGKSNTYKDDKKEVPLDSRDVKEKERDKDTLSHFSRARVERHSTKRHAHQVEKVEVDFFDSSDDDDLTIL